MTDCFLQSRALAHRIDLKAPPADVMVYCQHEVVGRI